MAGPGSPEPFYAPAVSLLVRFRWAVLAAWAAAQWWVDRDHTGDWAYFNGAASQVFGATIGVHHLAGGLHTYANNPVQFGPPPILLAEAARLAGPDGRAVFGFMIMALCVPALWLLEDAANRLALSSWHSRRFVSLAGMLLVPVWGVMAFGATHMDDALVLFGIAGVINLLARNRPLAAAIVAGSAAAAQPWGVILLGLLVAPSVRRPIRAMAVAAFTLVVWWSPFLLDPRTVTSAGGFRIPVAVDTPLHLALPHTVLMPLWVRPVQLVVGLLLTAAVARCNPWGALLLGVSFRLLIDPGGYNYYWCGLLFAAIAFELLTEQRWALATPVAWLLSLNWLGLKAPTADAVIAVLGLVACAGLSMRRGSHLHPRHHADVLPPSSRHIIEVISLPAPHGETVAEPAGVALI